MAAAGWPADKPLPEIDQRLVDAEDQRFDTKFSIAVAGQNYGYLRLGISTSLLEASQGNILRQGVLIAATEVGLSFLLLGLLGFWLTRQLAQLIRAAEQVGAGDYSVNLPVTSRDEVGRLAEAFNHMMADVRDRVARLKQEEERFHAIADYTVGWESWLDAQGRIVWTNPSALAMTGYTPAELAAMSDFPAAIVVPEDRVGTVAKFQAALQGESEQNFEFRILEKEGSVKWVSASWQPIYDAAATSLGVRVSIVDVTKRREAESALRGALDELRVTDEARSRYLAEAQEERARLSSLLDVMNLGILFVGADERVLYYNQAFLRIWLIPHEAELAGRKATEAMRDCSAALAQPDHLSTFLLQVPETHEVSDSVEIRLADDRLVTQLSYPVRNPEGRTLGRLWLYEDVTRERQTAEQLIYLAERDSLTGLYNRRRFNDELSRLIVEAERYGKSGALLFFDLDEFKYINDTFGHRAGDSILIRVAGEIGSVIRRNEVFGRLGGDEFAILVPSMETEAEVEYLAERVVRGIAQIPFRFDGQTLRLTTSVGVALFPKDANTAEELVAHADAAMYQAKDAGKNAWRRYRLDKDASKEMIKRLNWNDRIARALENNLLRLHFQGIYHTVDRSLAHLEALVRMVDEENPTQLIMPGHFIPLAEKSGKILDIDRWVIVEAIGVLARTPRLDSLAINVSGRSFDESTLPQFISDQLKSQGVEPHRLLVELTETSALSDLSDAGRFIEALHHTGCVICLDDFGTGFSSFAYLKHLSADILKIDGLFIRNLANDRDDQVFVKAIADVARGMGKVTVAEFVEDAVTLELLRGFGVDLVQGYHLDKPQADHPALRGG
jgi:diguanylate cyclase (GGDEF)-like protein/PAS domain S-box-containing protein